MSAFSWELVKDAFLLNVNDIFENLKNYSLDQLKADVQNPERLLEFYKSTDALVLAIAAMITLVLIHCAMGELTRDYSQVDRAWSILPAAYAWHFAFHDYLNRTSFHPRLLLAAVLISIWGTRLTYNFARKGGYGWQGRDYRFVYIQEKIGNVGMALLNFVFIGPFQDTLLLLMCTPLYLNTLEPLSSQGALNRVDVLASGLFLSLLLFEVIADDQQFMFQTRKHALLDYLGHGNKDKLKGDYKRGFICSSGLWQYSRHPNFFAEISMWWSVYLFSVAAHAQATLKDNHGVVDWMDPKLYLNWTVVGAFILTMLFQGSTWLTEYISAEKYPEYKNYQKSVNRFIPWFPQRQKSKTS
ncbi:hypothetical protein BDB00DRAFT_829203 [Zychaea mexicana]|uniref:uncharacterized protein n=1 Tax=Zychaea mexicana TaxID=64656 RepID=UPI0022FF11D6|nr:uncharacterized protein BDB00DRAFT_829203 [Zychaea mexicana]KAI9492299.1 hypothetical protein BDB00DRAFT_829203 [Zychaea mexicana]